MLYKRFVNLWTFEHLFIPEIEDIVNSLANIHLVLDLPTSKIRN